MAKKATESGMLSNPMKVHELIKAAGESLVLDTGSMPIEDFVYALRGVGGGEMTMLQAPQRQLQRQRHQPRVLWTRTPWACSRPSSRTSSEYVYTHPEVISNRK